MANNLDFTRLNAAKGVLESGAYPSSMPPETRQRGRKCKKLANPIASVADLQHHFDQPQKRIPI